MANSSTTNSGWGWTGTVEQFLSTTLERWEQSLAAHHTQLLGYRPSESQFRAWRDEYDVSFAVFRACVLVRPNATGWGVAFEYELPLEGGRRPDVVVLAGGAIVVLEFKSEQRATQAHVDQVEAYARDLAEYHERSHGRSIHSIVVLPNAPGFADEVGDTVVTGPDGLADYLAARQEPGEIDLVTWLRSPYTPLPSLVEAARRIFQHEPLPHVKRALSAGIPETIDLITSLIERAEADGHRLLVFLSGVPGSGKTLVGLRLVYERSETAGRATFLSGNGPLVQVLQDALHSRAFVRDLHAFIRTNGINARTPGEHVIVFDEAQRAWDESYMRHKRGVGRSEPSLLIEIGGRVSGWAALVGLVGEGQEIHSGEEAGMGQWREAVREGGIDRWSVHSSPSAARELGGLGVTEHEQLDLTVSLRSRRAARFHQWVQLLLEGSLALAARLAVSIHNDVYPMYLTRDLDDAAAYVRARYVGEREKRYGLVASSHAKLPQRFDVDNSWMATSHMNIARWFNAPPHDPSSCCQLDRPVTEFGCQGLELDLPIVCWGEDMLWDGRAWSLNPVRRKYPLDDPAQVLRNTYRVLLTRGRDGVAVFIPPDPRLDATEHALLAAGVLPLPDGLEAEAVGPA